MRKQNLFYSIYNKARLSLSILWTVFRIKFLNKRVPLYCEWEITHYCNLDCRFCSTGASSNYLRGTELSTEEIYSRIDQLKECGTKLLHFSGGEPTLRKDFLEIVRYAKKQGLLVSVTSNGITNKSTLLPLIEADLVRISIDGKAELHDFLRKKKGGYLRSIKTIKELNEHGITPLVTCVYTKQTTVKDVLPLMETIKNELKARITFLKMGRAITEKNTVDETLIPSIDEFFMFFEEMKSRYGNLVISTDPYLDMMKSGGLDKYGCRAVDITVTLDPKGFARFPCNSLAKHTPMVEGNLNDLFHSPEVKALAPLQGKLDECAGCAVRCMASASALLNLSGLTKVHLTYLKEILWNTFTKTPTQTDLKVYNSDLASPKS